MTRAKRGTSDISVATRSDYHSVRSDFSDSQSCQPVVSMRSPAIVVPSPACQKPIESVGLTSMVPL